jgi:predicted cupin superfamily sugar epimerase
MKKQLDATAEEIKQVLGLQPHPTCGFVVETYRSDLRVPRDALADEYQGARPLGSALYFLVTPDAQIVLHRIRSDQFYHHYFGDPLEVLMLYSDGTGAIATVGDDLRSGARPQPLYSRRHVPRFSPGSARGWLRAAGEHRVARGRAPRR